MSERKRFVHWDLILVSDYRGIVLSMVVVYPFDVDGDMVFDEEYQNTGTVMIANIPIQGGSNPGIIRSEIN